ncbi:MAG: zf-HC2 domain-containing protein [Kiritimatiellae bacterium]|nr:zf-HC2 domain-containing protein [Kiritimatiellia bacterium]
MNPADERHFAYTALDAYLHGDLPFLKRLACARHLKRCPRCQALLERVREDNRLLSDLGSTENHEC